MFSDLVLYIPDTAKKGIQKHLVARSFSSAQDVKQFQEKLPKKMKACALIEKADHKTLKKMEGVSQYIAVWGGSIALNRFAVSNKAVDFLIAPCTPEQAFLDQASIRLAKEKNVSIVFPLSQFEKLSLFKQSQVFKHYLLVVKMCKKMKVKAFVFSCAQKEAGLKTKNDLLEIGKELGFTEKQLTAWNGEL